MSAFQLVLNPDSIVRRPGRTAVGAVHVEFDGRPFPARDWSDFALAFLEAYWTAVLALREEYEGSVSFYEGPYVLEFEREGGSVTVRALDNGTESHRQTIDYTSLLEMSMQAVLPWISYEQAADQT